MKTYAYDEDRNRLIESTDLKAIGDTMPRLQANITKLSADLGAPGHSPEIRDKLLNEFNAYMDVWNANQEFYVTSLVAKRAQAIAASLKWPPDEADAEGSAAG